MSLDQVHFRPCLCSHTDKPLDSKPPSSFQIDPPTNLVDIYYHEEGSSEEDRHISLSPQDEGLVSLQSDTYGPNRTYQVQILSSATEPPLLLTKFSLKTDAEGKLDVHYVDLRATVINITFKSHDLPMRNADIRANFVSPKQEKFSLIGKTDEKGQYFALLPPGTILGLTIKTETQVEEVKEMLVIPIPVPSSVNHLRRLKCTSVEFHASHTNTKIAILGSTARSMCSTGQMDALRKAFGQIFEKSLRNKWSIMMGEYNSSQPKFCCDGSWIQSSQRPDVIRWINSLFPSMQSNHTALDVALTTTLRMRYDLTDIYILTDGDISPFSEDLLNLETRCCTGRSRSASGSISPTLGSPRACFEPRCWSSFRAKYPRVNFHFVAVGNRASNLEALKEMASLGNGLFCHFSL